MTFHIKMNVTTVDTGENNGSICLEFPIRLRKIFDLDHIDINFYAPSSDMEIIIISHTINKVGDNSVIYKILDLFISKNSNYKDLFYLASDSKHPDRMDRYILDTSHYELSKKEFDQIIMDFIDSLREAMNLGPISVKNIHQACSLFEYRPLEMEQQEKAISLSSSNLSMFSEKGSPLYSELSSDETAEKSSNESGVERELYMSN